MVLNLVWFGFELHTFAQKLKMDATRTTFFSAKRKLEGNIKEEKCNIMIKYINIEI